jgi:sulfatase modifying factor 1
MIASLRALVLISLCAMTPSAAAEPTFLRASLEPPARIRIEAGHFTMGSDDAAIERAVATCLLSPPTSGSCNADAFADERAQRDVALAAFSIDRQEVSNQAYQRCVSAGVCLPSGLSDSDVRVGRPEHPVAAVSWRDAQRYCGWVKGQLPTEAQWERAARGNSARSFPWGYIWNARLANHGQADGGEDELDGFRFAAPVDALPDGRSFYGLLNLAGNVAEWVSDRFGPYDSAGDGGTTPRSAVEPEGPTSGNERVVRGGSWRTPPQALRVSARARMAEPQRRPDVGFRCAYTPPRAKVSAQTPAPTQQANPP